MPFPPGSENNIQLRELPYISLIHNRFSISRQIGFAKNKRHDSVFEKERKK